MIVAPNDDWLYVSVPKCGTSTMYALLGSFGGRRIGGGGFHPTDVPDDLRRVFTFTMVRNPYARAVSLWWTTTQRDRADDRYSARHLCERWGGDPDKFSLWVVWLASQWREHRGQPLFLPMAVHLERVRLDCVLKLEAFPRCLALLPFWRRRPADTSIPHRNPSEPERGDWRRYYADDDVAAEAVRCWARRDFRTFGYDEENPCPTSRSTSTCPTAPSSAGS